MLHSVEIVYVCALPCTWTLVSLKARNGNHPDLLMAFCYYIYRPKHMSVWTSLLSMIISYQMNLQMTLRGWNWKKSDAVCRSASSNTRHGLSHNWKPLYLKHYMTPKMKLACVPISAVSANGRIPRFWNLSSYGSWVSSESRSWW